MTITSTYIVLADVDITYLMVEESMNGHRTYRKSLDRTQSILKFSKLHPDTMSGRTKYGHAGILQFLIDNTVDWNVSGS